MATVASLLVRIASDTSDLESGFSGAGKVIGGVGKQLTQTGKSLTKNVTAPIIGIGTAAVIAGSNFESAMSEVAAISGATGKEFDALRDQAKDLGATTMFSASEAAAGMGFLARAGFETTDILGAMPGLLDLAAAGNVDLASAADIASNIMSGFALSASEASSVSDVLAKAAASSNTNVEQLGTAMSFAAPIAKGLGLSIEETSAAIGIFSDAGIQGSRAGTALRGGLTRLTKPSKEAQELMEELGFSAFDTSGQFIGLEGVVGKLESATANMTQEQRAQALATIFGQEAMSAWSALVDSGTDTLSGLTGELKNSEGFAAETAATMQDNLGGSLKELTSALEGAAIELSEVLIPAIKGITEFITGAVRAFSNLDSRTKTIIVVVAGLVAAIGPLLLILGGLFSAISTIISVMSVVGPIIAAISGPIGIAIAIVGALIAAGVFLINNWDAVVLFFTETVPAKLQQFLAFMGSLPGRIIEFLKTLPERIGFILGLMVGTAIRKGSEFVDSFVNFIKELPGKVLAFIVEMNVKAFQKFTEIVQFAKNAGRNLVDGFIGFVKNIPNSVRNVFNNVTSFIKNLPGKLFAKAKSIGRSLWNGFKKGIGIGSPSLIERALFAIGDSAFDTVDMLNRSTVDFQRFGRNISMPIPAPVPTSGNIRMASASANGVGVAPVATEPTAGMATAGGITIQVENMNVREESDVRKVAQELFRLQQTRLRAQGGRI